MLRRLVPILRFAQAIRAAVGAMVRLDRILQIRLFVKLKLAKCAPIPGWPEVGFFMPAQVG